jgi:hypothetical protein
VFKNADVVHISSGPFQFKLDRTGKLGMITPILESFPSEHLKPGYTQILLKLNNPSRLNDINVALDEIKPELLIFLRKLSCMKIRTATRRIFFYTAVESEYEGETVSLLALNDNGRDTTWEKYIMVHHQTRELAVDDRRSGVHESEIVLAFPVETFGDTIEPQISARSTYAYLPIGKFGFSVIMTCFFERLC